MKAAALLLLALSGAAAAQSEPAPGKPVPVTTAPVGRVPRAASASVVKAPPTGRIIDRVRFGGNASFSDRTLRRWMKQRPSSFFSSVRFDRAQFEDDLRSLHDFYLGEGFFRAQVEGASDTQHSSPGKVDLLIRVSEGDRWTLRRLDLDLDDGADLTPGLRDSLLKLIKVTPPGPYRLREAVHDRDRLYGELISLGYLNATVRLEENRCDSCRQADVRYRIDSGPRVRVRNVRIDGLHKTRPWVAMRELALDSGDLLIPRKAGLSRANLLRTGLFTDASVIPLPADSAQALRTLLVTVAERQGGNLGGGFGYGTSERLRVLVSAEHRNLSGRAIRLGTRLSYGQRRRGAEAELAMPWTFGRRLATSIHLSHERVSPRSYRAEMTRGGISLSHPIGYFWRVDGGYSAARVSLLGKSVLAKAPARARLGELNLGLTRETRDDLEQPRRGSYLRISQELVSPWLGGQSHYDKTEIRRIRVQSLGPVTWAARLQAGWITSYDTFNNVPLSERFFAGGDETIRGFPEDEVGPVDAQGIPQGGRIRALGAVEARFPALWRIGLSTFVDAGQVTNEVKELSLGRVSVGAGFGIRLNWPVGRLRLDVGFPLTERYADGAQVYLGTGQVF